ncbi:MAG: hypothetical protein AMS27_09630 [Bacteroides sp. SM23_62_1]|nr:MAG: hypothetical protein AMS27_09630 [Bacteroides sp. SM23_62_1]
MTISKRLIRWYLKTRRDLPWRKTKDPYTIWVSEVILQQTKVDQGLQYFHRFMKRFPDLPSLAMADPDEVMKIWQGLGYYTRARNLHDTARYINMNSGGMLPSTYAGLIKLKGIGPYTAAAVASIAFGEKVPVVDGNVIRVLSRVFGIRSSGTKTFFEKALEIMDTEEPGLFNQALMEFGALNCTPVTPSCPACILRKECFAYNYDAVRDLPVKKVKPEIKKRYFHYFIILDNDNMIIRKRDGSDIWKGLYDFPLIETGQPASLQKLRDTPGWKNIFGSPGPEVLKYSTIRKHILTHQVIFARFYFVGRYPARLLTGNYLKIHQKKLNDLPLPRLIDRFIKETNWLCI